MSNILRDLRDSVKSYKINVFQHLTGKDNNEEELLLHKDY